MKKYRIVTDQYLGYEVQEWIWYWPFWTQSGFCNTNSSIAEAEKYISELKFKKTVVKNNL